MKKLVGVALALALAGCASLGQAPAASSWVGVWGASPTPPPANARTFENQTIRQVLRVSAGGTKARIRLTNEYSDKPLEIGAAVIYLEGGDRLQAGSIRFDGKTSVTIPAKAPMLSDPIDFPLSALDSVSISLFLPQATGPCTCHPGARADGFISPPGDFTRRQFEPVGTFTSRAFISGVEVLPAAPAHTLIAFGDSITDGTASSNNANKRWPDILAERFKAAGMNIGISNQAIAGNRVLSHGMAVFGESALTRFDRDVLSVPGAKWMIVLEGVNDIGMGGATPPSAEQIVAGYRQLIARAHDRGIKVYGATILPYEGARYYTEAGDGVRQAINSWMRGSAGGKDGFDRVIDLDAAIQDPANPKKMKADLQSGDWLHPNDAGYKVMGEAIELSFFR